MEFVIRLPCGGNLITSSAYMAGGPNEKRHGGSREQAFSAGRPFFFCFGFTFAPSATCGVVNQ